jgi:5-formyltetrahydrofolate cyclo-ligase
MVNMTKKELRKQFKALRSALPPAQLLYDSWSITTRLLHEVNWAKYSTLHLYLPMLQRHELTTFPLIYALWRDYPHLRVCVPRVNVGENRLENLLLTSNTRLIVESFGQYEPADVLPVPAKEIDIAIVPLLAYDKRNYRVGYGKGHYDRFLPTCAPHIYTLGISQFAPVERIEDTDNFDIPLDRIIQA